MNPTEPIPTLRQFTARWLADVRREYGCRIDARLRLYYVEMASDAWFRRLSDAAWQGAPEDVLPMATWRDLERQSPDVYARLKVRHRTATTYLSAET